LEDLPDIISYRRVFKTSWRMTRFMTWDLTRFWPGGVPLGAGAYFAGTCAAVWLVSLLPVIGDLVKLLPWVIRYLGIPAGVAYLGITYEPDGRSFHAAVIAYCGLWLRHQSRKRRRRPRLRPVAVRWDASRAALLNGIVHGPGRLVVEGAEMNHYDGWFKSGYRITPGVGTVDVTLHALEEVEIRA
jgi:hypothetical protein